MKKSEKKPLHYLKTVIEYTYIQNEEAEFQAAIKRMDARKAQMKAEEKKLKKDLTAQIKKAGHLKSGSLDFNRPENMYYSDKDTARYLEGTSYMDAYEANKFADGEW